MLHTNKLHVVDVSLIGLIEMSAMLHLCAVLVAQKSDHEPQCVMQDFNNLRHANHQIHTTIDCTSYRHYSISNKIKLMLGLVMWKSSVTVSL